MFNGADAPDTSGPVDGWQRLQRATATAIAAAAEWRERALAAEAEIVRLRRVLEEVGSATADGGDPEEERRRLRAENAVLLSRTMEARKRIRGVLDRLSVLEGGR